VTPPSTAPTLIVAVGASFSVPLGFAGYTVTVRVFAT
jgi:hypothetical protein